MLPDNPNTKEYGLRPWDCLVQVKNPDEFCRPVVAVWPKSVHDMSRLSSTAEHVRITQIAYPLFINDQVGGTKNSMSEIKIFLV
jgi:hypothetical protein